MWEYDTYIPFQRLISIIEVELFSLQLVWKHSAWFFLFCSVILLYSNKGTHLFETEVCNQQETLEAHLKLTREPLSHDDTVVETNFQCFKKQKLTLISDVSEIVAEIKMILLSSL